MLFSAFICGCESQLIALMCLQLPSVEPLNSTMLSSFLTTVLCHACRVVLVGDPQQLPATILSRQAQLANMERSMFER